MGILICGGSVVTMDAQNTVLTDHDVLIVGDRIAAIGRNLPRDGADLIDASGALVMPGLIDTHMHMWQYPWRGRVFRKWGSAPYMKVFWPAREVYEPEDTFDGILGSAYEMIEHGITGTLDFFHGANASSDHADAALAAHRQSGQRVQLAYGMTTAYSAAGSSGFELDRQARVADFDRLRAAAARLGDDRVEVGLALITPSDALMDAFAEEILHARSSGAHMSFHQNAPGEIRAIYERGLLGPDILPVHANTVSDQELTWMAEARMPVSITPQTEITSARSMSVLRRSFLKGVPLSIGIDTPAILPIDMLGQLRLTYLLMQGQDGQAMHEAVRAPLNVDLDPQTATFDDILRAGTAGGAYGIGRREDLGIIREGSLADVIVVRPRDSDVALEDPVAHLILGSTPPSSVDTVVINGQIRKRNARLVDVDADELAERNRAVRNRILARMAGTSLSN